jgi:site-specific recombinase XerD
VPLPRFALEALSIHISARGTREEGVIFRNPHGGLWRRGAINSCFWKPTLVRAGLPTSYGMHALRHTYASGLIAEGLHQRGDPGPTRAQVHRRDHGHLRPPVPDQNEETL